MSVTNEQLAQRQNLFRNANERGNRKASQRGGSAKACQIEVIEAEQLLILHVRDYNRAVQVNVKL